MPREWAERNIVLFHLPNNPKWGSSGGLESKAWGYLEWDSFPARIQNLEYSCPLCFFSGPNEQDFKFKSSPLPVRTSPALAPLPPWKFSWHIRIPSKFPGLWLKFSFLVPSDP